MKRIVEFPVNIGEKIIYVSSDAYPFEPNMKKLYVVMFGYNQYHDEFCMIVNEDPKAQYGGEVYLDEFGVDAFLLDEEDKAREVLNERVELWKKKNILKN